MKKLIFAIAIALTLSACGTKQPTGDMERDAKYLVEQCVKDAHAGRDEHAKQLTEEYMQYYRDRGTAQVSEFAYTVLTEITGLPEDDRRAVLDNQ